jgi:hypothetical protein
MGPMVHAPGGGDSLHGEAVSGSGDFAITLKGWRSQLRWALTQREEDPARVWLEVISIDERSKRALAGASAPDQVTELQKFRDRLETSIKSLTDDLGDENVAPLYSWLDLVRQRRRLCARIDEARIAVTQARAARASSVSGAPATEDEATEQVARAQAELEQWQKATPPAPPPDVRALWDEQGGEGLAGSMPRDPIAAARQGDEARATLANAAGRAPGVHPWVKSRAELIAVPSVGAVTVIAMLFAFTGAEWARPTAVVGTVALGFLVGWGVYTRTMEKTERIAAIDWVWHHAMYDQRARLADLELGWLRTLLEAERALRLFDQKAAAGGQLRDFENWRPDLADMVHEVARDTEEPS